MFSFPYFVSLDCLFTKDNAASYNISVPTVKNNQTALWKTGQFLNIERGPVGFIYNMSIKMTYKWLLRGKNLWTGVVNYFHAIDTLEVGEDYNPFWE